VRNRRARAATIEVLYRKAVRKCARAAEPDPEAFDLACRLRRARAAFRPPECGPAPVLRLPSHGACPSGTENLAP